MTTTAEQLRAYRGPAILSIGFRPFFLAGAFWAALCVALWLPMLSGHIALPSAFTALEWHVHELTFGYVPAIIAGFLLTAVPNWTGRLPIAGTRLLFLFLIWVLGRLAVLFSVWLGSTAAAAIDLLFMGVLGAAIAREIVAGNNTRNLKLLVVVGLLFSGNALFHWEAVAGTGGGYGTRMGVAGVVFLIMLIGGRIIPSFTRNWLVKQQEGRLPKAFDKLDAGIIAVCFAALASWTALPGHIATAILAALAGALNIVRLSRWAGDRTLAEPLVLILHVAYLFVPIGFFLLALAIFTPDLVTSAGALHGWTTGAIALMTLAVMTRASLGHAGRPLTAAKPVQFIYIAAILAACTRLIAAFDVLREPMLYISAAAWVAAFAGFVIAFAPLLTQPRSS